jgi:hypothetical protein
LKFEYLPERLLDRLSKRETDDWTMANMIGASFHLCRLLRNGLSQRPRCPVGAARSAFRSWLIEVKQEKTVRGVATCANQTAANEEIPAPLSPPVGERSERKQRANLNIKRLETKVKARAL